MGPASLPSAPGVPNDLASTRHLAPRARRAAAAGRNTRSASISVDVDAYEHSFLRCRSARSRGPKSRAAQSAAAQSRSLLALPEQPARAPERASFAPGCSQQSALFLPSAALPAPRLSSRQRRRTHVLTSPFPPPPPPPGRRPDRRRAPREAQGHRARRGARPRARARLAQLRRPRLPLRRRRPRRRPRQGQRARRHVPRRVDDDVPRVVGHHQEGGPPPLGAPTRSPATLPSPSHDRRRSTPAQSASRSHRHRSAPSSSTRR